MSYQVLEKYSKADIFAEKKKSHQNSTGRFPPPHLVYHSTYMQGILIIIPCISFFSFKANPDSQRVLFGGGGGALI